MRSTRLAVLALAALAIPGAAQAQRVVADISINQGPIAGRVIIGDRYHPRPEYREYVVVREHRGGGWYRNHGYHPVRMYWDGYRYYDRPYRNGLNVVWVYERGGRYYDYARNDYRRRVERHDNRQDHRADRRDDRRDDRQDHRADRRNDRQDHRQDHRRDDRNDYRGRNGHQ